ncbi:MAG: SPASM domain-containing protein [Theionarchaea archaeon]|nr:SPASM domain-containing protein [Theionarchaea archaeon]
MKLSNFNLIIPTETEGEYLLTNTMSGAVIGIDEELKSVIEKGDITALDPEQCKALTELGIFIPDHVDEYRTIKVQYERAKYAIDSLTFTLITTYACNLACPYCYEGKGELLQGTMNRNTRERALTFMKKKIQETGAREFSIGIYGGEPLLNFDESTSIMDSLFIWAEEQGILYTSSMMTNGTLMTREIAENLQGYNTKSVQITLDGAKRLHDRKRVYKNGKGTFDDIIASTGILLDYEIPVVFRINIDTGNKPYLSELLDELEALNLKDVPVICAAISEGQACGSYSECIHDANIFETLYEARNLVSKRGQAIRAVQTHESHFFCGFLREGQYLIDPLADVYKCLTFVGLKQHSIGHITADGEIEEYTWAYYDWMSRDPLTIKECQKCVMLPSCGGGCAAVSYERHNSYHACGCYDPLSKNNNQVRWYLEENFPRHFKEGKIIWD